MKRHKCRNCKRIRMEKFMEEFVALEDGIPVKVLYPEKNKGKRITWECGNCEENIHTTSKK